MRQARRATEQLICTIADWIELGRTAVQIGGSARVIFVGVRYLPSLCERIAARPALLSVLSLDSPPKFLARPGHYKRLG